jgi:DNA repair ATPase RecN
MGLSVGEYQSLLEKKHELREYFNLLIKANTPIEKEGAIDKLINALMPSWLFHLERNIKTMKEKFDYKLGELSHKINMSNAFDLNDSLNELKASIEEIKSMFSLRVKELKQKCKKYDKKIAKTDIIQELEDRIHDLEDRDLKLEEKIITLAQHVDHVRDSKND